MSREEDKLIAVWLGWRSWRGSKNKPWKWKKPYGGVAWEYVTLPNFSTSDQDAITLLPVLVERGYVVDLNSDELGTNCQLWVKEKCGNSWEHIFVCESLKQSTFAQAISSVVLELIKKEK